jgi:site-specific recombinase XerC
MTLLAPTLEAFFTQRLMTQRQASPHTISGYRDTMRLLLSFAAKRSGKSPSKLDISDLDVRLVSAFLDHLEHDRGNTASTRTCAWPRSGRCFATPPCAIPNTPR